MNSGDIEDEEKDEPTKPVETDPTIPKVSKVVLDEETGTITLKMAENREG